jgi:hypothetical protein
MRKQRNDGTNKNNHKSETQMTDLDRFIKQFESHVKQILYQDELGVVHLGMYEFGPVKIYSKIYEDDIYEFTELATKEVIQKLENISFIEITDDPTIGTLTYSPILANNFLGIRCFIEEINYNPVFSHMEMESNNYIHTAAIYECMRRVILKFKPQQGKKFSQKRNDNINIILNAMEVFQNWAINEGIAIESNFYQPEIILNSTLNNQEKEREFKPRGNFSRLKLDSRDEPYDIRAKNVIIVIEFIFKNYPNGEPFNGSKVCRKIKDELPSFPKTTFPRVFHDARGFYTEIYKELFEKVDPYMEHGIIERYSYKISEKYQ